MISQHPDAPGRRLSISLKYTGPQSKEEGEKLFKDANKKRLAFQGCRIFRLCSREKTDDDRAESIRKYLRAAHHFMNANEWEKAGESYENCARLQEMGNEMETIDAAGSYASAALCYKQDKCIKEKNGQQPTNRSNRSVSTVMERIRLPSIDESKLNPLDTSLSRLAHMQMDYKNYEKAKANFEKLAVGLYTDESNEDHADNFFFKAAMCALAHDPELALESVKRYFEMRPNLQETQQFALWFELFRSLHSKDQEQFSQLIDDNREAKIWVQKIIADLCNQLHFTGMYLAIALFLFMVALQISTILPRFRPSSYPSPTPNC